MKIYRRLFERFVGEDMENVPILINYGEWYDRNKEEVEQAVKGTPVEKWNQIRQVAWYIEHKFRSN